MNKRIISELLSLHMSHLLQLQSEIRFLICFWNKTVLSIRREVWYIDHDADRRKIFAIAAKLHELRYSLIHFQGRLRALGISISLFIQSPVTKLTFTIAMNETIIDQISLFSC